MPFVISCKKQLHPGMFSAKFSWNWSSGSGEENLYISSIYFCYFIFISPQKARDPSIWKKWTLFTPNCFVSSLYFRYFVIISFWKNAGPFTWTNLNPHHPRMLCPQFGWNCSSVSWEEDENVKFTTTTDNGKIWSEKIDLAFGSSELRIKLSIISRIDARLHSRNSTVSVKCVWLHETQLSRDANIKESRLFMYILNNSDILFRFG